MAATSKREELDPVAAEIRARIEHAVARVWGRCAPSILL